MEASEQAEWRRSSKSEATNIKVLDVCRLTGGETEDISGKVSVELIQTAMD